MKTLRKFDNSFSSENDEFNDVDNLLRPGRVGGRTKLEVVHSRLQTVVRWDKIVRRVMNAQQLPL